MKTGYSPTLAELKDELASVRKQSLEAARNNDCVGVARLTIRTAQINRMIGDLNTENAVPTFRYSNLG